ncbi:hypothetical protein [Notoacmeibacter ruber]|uniref:DUF3618 domain-containing protein n=1 Tax=Notoacmeibacter ruber TaxID=2670375 RepID=A0A3L7JJU4_9HYPH|nr:hypothetical protein [Notoacmeibacter ruber]RLQ88752.1 hypothetical protein D8780_11540 [Notoacmeibacter ruber]
MSFFRENDWRDDLSEQLDALRSEVSSLRREASRKSSRALSSTRHSSEDVFHAIRDYFSPPSIYTRGWRRASDNPGTTAAAALVGVALVGLAATFFLNSSSGRKDHHDVPGTPTPPPPEA